MQFLFLGHISGFVYFLIQSSHIALKIMVLMGCGNVYFGRKVPQFWKNLYPASSG